MFYLITFASMKLIADSGSTKTDWVLTDGTRVVETFQTQGINPFHQSEEVILSVLREVACSPIAIQFYGSGVRPELVPVMERLLRTAFPSAESIEAHGDLLGAARALFGHGEGIACILGTGANSGLYDGNSIVQNVPPLGYILGDEGSGAVLGKRFLNLLYKGFIDNSLKADFQKDMNLSMADVIDRVYRQPMPNRFLASLSLFISRHLEHPQLRQLVIDNFRDFFRRNVAHYQRPDLPVGFVGSMAYHYHDQLREAAAAEGFRVGRVLKSPIEGLIAFE